MYLNLNIINNKYNIYMHKLSVGAIFKNESNSIKEWIEHYLFHGVEHFFLIDDSSSDNTIEIITPYIDRNIVTLFYGNNWDHYNGRQKDMYNHFILPQLNKTKWLLIVDVDEYMWSELSIDLNDILEKCNHLGQIQVEQTLFGSNGFIQQPSSIVSNFLTRSSLSPTPGNRKYFVNSSFKINCLFVHHALFVNEFDEKNNFLCINKPWFILNHYNCQSYNFWTNIKCLRGDCDNYRLRNPDDFFDYDQNEVVDTGLASQNNTIPNTF